MFVCFCLTEDVNDHLPQSNLAPSHTNVIHNDLTPVNRTRAVTAGVMVNNPPTATTTINNITNTTTNATATDNNSPRLFNNFSNSQSIPHAHSPKVKSPPIIAEKLPPPSPAKPKRTSGSHTGVADIPRAPVQSPRVSSQSPNVAAAQHGVRFGVVETIPRGNEEDDETPVEPPVVPKKPPVPPRSSLSPPAPNTSPNAKNVGDPKYLIFSPDDDESSSEGDYDEDETEIGTGELTHTTIQDYSCVIWNFRWSGG